MVLDEEQIRAIKLKLLDQLSNLPKGKQKAVKTQIESMSAKQLEEFLKQNVQMDDCVFCSIVEGKTDSYKIYEDEHFIGVISIKPISKGHLLLIPKEHSSPDETLLKKVSKKLGRVLERVFPGVEIDYKIEEMFNHKYMSIFIKEEPTDFEPNKEYFLDLQNKILDLENGEDAQEGEDKVEEKNEESEPEPLYKVGLRIP